MYEKNVPANWDKREFHSFVTWEKQNPTWTRYKAFFMPVTKPCLEREPERDRARYRDRDRDRDREGQRETEIDRQRTTERQREPDRQTDIERNT